MRRRVRLGRRFGGRRKVRGHLRRLGWRRRVRGRAVGTGSVSSSWIGRRRKRVWDCWDSRLGLDWDFSLEGAKEGAIRCRTKSLSQSLRTTLPPFPSLTLPLLPPFPIRPLHNSDPPRSTSSPACTSPNPSPRVRSRTSLLSLPRSHLLPPASQPSSTSNASSPDPISPTHSPRSSSLPSFLPNLADRTHEGSTPPIPSPPSSRTSSPPTPSQSPSTPSSSHSSPSVPSPPPSHFFSPPSPPSPSGRAG